MTQQATSIAAERTVNKARMRALVLWAFEIDAMQDAGPLPGLTDYDLEHRTGLAGNSVRPRRGELLKAGIIEDSLERRPSPAGRGCIVWRLVKR